MMSSMTDVAGGIGRDPVRGLAAALETRSGNGFVKICGLRQAEHAVAAAHAGADLLGFIFAPSRRQVAPEEARRAITAARQAVPDRGLIAVGVFVDADATEINATAALAGLDLVQLSGEEPPALLAELAQPVVKALKPPLGSTRAAVSEAIARYAGAANAPIYVQIDGYVPGMAGGAGVRADWDLVRRLAETWPVCLAGGLDPDNVGEAIRVTRPALVDVASGVETDGVKDPAKIRAFIAAARDTFAQLGLATT